MRSRRVQLRDAVHQRLINLALTLNPTAGHADYTRFIVLGRSRTGSSYLRGLLNAHTQVVAFRELFKQTPEIEWGLPGHGQSQRLLRLRRDDPIKFLETQVFRRYPRSVAAVGFTIFYRHAQTDGWKALWDHLRRDRDVKVVHITRQNLLRSYLSRVTARKTGTWIKQSREPTDAPPITLDYDACLEHFERVRQSERDFASFFADHPVIDVVYEDLADDFSAQMKKVESFLGLDHQVVTPTTSRQSDRSLASSIENYDELRDRFRGSPWEGFFD